MVGWRLPDVRLWHLADIDLGAEHVARGKFAIEKSKDRSRSLPPKKHNSCLDTAGEIRQHSATRRGEKRTAMAYTNAEIIKVMLAEGVFDNNRAYSSMTECLQAYEAWKNRIRSKLPGRNFRKSIRTMPLAMWRRGRHCGLGGNVGP